MIATSAVFRLDKILDDPRYEGFSGDPGILKDIPADRPNLNWRVRRMAKKWIPIHVNGRVRKFNDYPCISVIIPAFSDRAVAALAEILNMNGELLPIHSALGTYYIYNCTTVANVLDIARSQVQWLEKPNDALEIRHHVFKSDGVNTLSIFRIPQMASRLYVTSSFVDRANEAGLKGFDFQRVWPLPDGINWKELAKLRRHKLQTEGLEKGKTIKGNAVIIRLQFRGRRQSASATENRAIQRIIESLDDLLVGVDSKQPYFGSVEGYDFGAPGECRLFLSAPDADDLLSVLAPWLRTLDWPSGFQVIKRYGRFDDAKAQEAVVEVWHN